MKEQLESIGKIVKTMREYRGLTQQELASIANVSRVRIGQIERGDDPTSIDSLIKISSALNCYLDISLTPVETAE